MSLGKRVGSKIWVHQCYEDDLGLDWFLSLRNAYWERFWERIYDVVRVDTVARTAAFIQCARFDEDPEPKVGESLLMRSVSGRFLFTATPGLKFVYHHKHLFVGTDYKGFDLAKSWQRSAVIEQLKKEGLLDSRRMGAVSYWQDHVHLVEERLHEHKNT